MKFLTEAKRSHYCGELRQDHVGEDVILMGWVDTRRDHGGLVFVDLRDREGLVQVVLNPNLEPTQVAKDFRGEFVVAIEGRVRLRPEGMENKKMGTGEVEVEALRCEVLSKAKTPPFQVMDTSKVSESLRLKYRYLDLRSPRLQEYLKVRHQAAQIMRQTLTEKGFWEVETPILYKSTPEGARDYLVPSRVSQGHFYALPQSPQTLKQLLMIAGYDRYFQLAKCFRDEDLRADRQPEFSQIDMEMSFVDAEDIMAVTEELLRAIWKGIRGQEVSRIPRMSHEEAMNRFGNDKPDLRIPWELQDLNEAVRGCGFKVFDDVVERGGAVKGLAVPGLGSASRGRFDKLTAEAKQMGAKGLVWVKEDGGSLSTPIAKFFDKDQLKKIFRAAGGTEGSAVLIVADDWEISCAALAHLRLLLGQELGAVDESQDRFLWVTDFPLFEYSPEEKRWVSRHHPFTMPEESGLATLLEGKEENYAHIKAKAYDLVCNGHELAGGSVRIHQQEIQAAIFKSLGLTEEETKEKFGFFIEALDYGTPPHGGIAWGFDRLAMILCRTEAIRDVIAFPKTAKASCLMSEAPGAVAREQLLELGIRVIKD